MKLLALVLVGSVISIIVGRLLDHLLNKQIDKRIDMKTADLVSAIQALDAQVKQVKTSVDNLIAATTNADVPQAVTDAVTQLQTDVNALGTDLSNATGGTTPPPAAP